MRILLINKFYSHRGGAERCLFDQERWLRRAGHEVHVFAQRQANGEPSQDASDFVDEVQFDRDALSALRGVGRFFWSERVRRGLQAAIERHRPDLAILHNFYHHLGPVIPLTLSAMGVPALMILHDHKVVCPAYAAWRAGKRCTECRGQQFYHAAQHGCGGSRARGLVLAAESYWQWRVLHSYSRIQMFLVPSEYLRATLREMSFPFATGLLRNAVEAPAREPLPMSSRHLVGFAGRLSPEKGVDVLVRAAARLPKLHFRIAGDGPARPALESLARELSASNVRFLGQLTPGELRDELASWRISVVPSLSPENAPFAALDAMNHQIAVVGSAVGGLPELLEGRGLLCEPGNAPALAQTLERAYARPDQLASAAQKAREFIDAECRPQAHVASLLKYAEQARR